MTFAERELLTIDEVVEFTRLKNPKKEFDLNPKFIGIYMDFDSIFHATSFATYQ